ncbi:sulfotransferase domain-containing protein [Fontimonas sp. SYSU GA230001]|uniref:sulfotransferase domain-containing protein n=1 Tax=Fontimonas sp. SYSU GA230001 TaxID=3142450 RepID=UPI0032B54802
MTPSTQSDKRTRRAVPARLKAPASSAPSRRGLLPMLVLLRFANRKTRNSRALRRVGVWAYATALRANVFLPPPRVFLNGPGKSGTHLLSDCLSLLPRMIFSGRHFSLAEFTAPPSRPEDVHVQHTEPFVTLDEPALRRFIGRCRNGTFVTAHATYHPALHEMLRELQFRHVLLLRDPRDIAVSYVHYVMRETHHHHHAYFAQSLASDDQRLMATIRGFSAIPGVEALAPIGTRLRGFVQWCEDPSVLVCRYEQLVGPRGGGSLDAQIREVRRIAEFVGRPIDESRALAVADGMFSEKSLTFRKGGTGDWQHHFGPDHRAAFKEAAGDVLVRLGYERGDRW